jgi:hypothetical protein
MSDESSYIVQVFSSFAPKELNPLLLRLENEVSVRGAIQAALNKVLQMQPLAVLPSDNVDDYMMCIADGDGYAKVGSAPFSPQSSLRQIPSLEFPFMIFLGYIPVKALAAASEDVRQGSQEASKKPLHTTLTAAEKKTAEQEKRERELRREENLKAIERRRLDKEREAFQHCESYEVLRREMAAKRQQAEEEAQLKRRMRDEEDSLRCEAMNDVEKFNEVTRLDKHRQEMQEAVEEEKRRSVELRKAREEQLLQQQLERERLKRERAALLLEEQNSRLSQSLDRLIDDLHQKISLDAKHNVSRLDQEILLRKEIERTESDLRSIALLEDRRHAPKIAERTRRVAGYQKDKQSFAEKELLSRRATEKHSEGEMMQRFSQWQTQQQRLRDATMSQLELQYRSQND